MRIHSLFAGSALALIAIVAPSKGDAQRPGAVASRPPKEADQYAFLIGEWSFKARPQAVGLAQRIHGVPNLHGTWKAWRALDGWGVEDELSISDASGNPVALVLFVRVYDATAKRWNVTSVDGYHGKFTNATAEWKDGVFTSVSDGKDADGNAVQTRVRITGITTTSFKYTQDRSVDGGKTWDEGILTIDATRTAATAAR